MTASRWQNFGSIMTKNFLHQQTLTLEHDQKFTPMNINLWTWPKKWYKWMNLTEKKYATTTKIIFGHIHTLMFDVNKLLFYFFILGHIYTLRLIVVIIFIIFSILFTMLMFVGEKFSVKFTFFGHIHFSSWFRQVNIPLEKKNIFQLILIQNPAVVAWR